MLSLAKYLVVLSLIVPAFAMAEAEGEASHEAEKGANLHLLGMSNIDKSKAVRPAKVTLEAPAAFAKVQGSATLKWSESKGAESYHVQVATDPNFKWLVKNEFFFKGNSLEVSGLQAGQQYFWRVAGMAPGNDSEYTKGFFVMSSFEAR